MISFLRKIYQFFIKVGSFVTAPFRIIYHLILYLVSLFGLLGRAKDAISSYLSFIPSEVYAIILVMIGVAIFYKILGREG